MSRSRLDQIDTAGMHLSMLMRKMMISGMDDKVSEYIQRLEGIASEMRTDLASDCLNDLGSLSVLPQEPLHQVLSHLSAKDVRGINKGFRDAFDSCNTKLNLRGPIDGSLTTGPFPCQDELHVDVACSNPQVTELTFGLDFEFRTLDRISKVLKGLRKLVLKECNHIVKDKSNVSYLLSALHRLTKLQALSLSKARLNVEAVPYLCSAIQNLPDVHTLDISQNVLGPQSVLILTSSLQGLTNLQDLNISNNYADDRKPDNYEKTLTMALKGLTNLRKLNISSNLLAAEDYTVFAPTLQGLTKLQTLNISRNSICGCGRGVNGMGPLAPAFQCLTNLQDLNMSYTFLNEEGVESLASALLKLQCLQFLDLSHTLLSISTQHHDLASLASALQGLTNLQTLDLSHNNIGPYGSASITNAFQGLPGLKLKSLDMSWNSLEDESGPLLAPGICRLTNLQTLKLGNNRLDTAGIIALALALRDLTDLQTLNLDANGFGAVGAFHLAQALYYLTNLENLDLDGAYFGAEGAGHLAPALQGLVNLQTLNINGNDMGIKGITTLVPALLKLPNLRDLKIYRSNCLTLADMATLDEELKGLALLPPNMSIHLQEDDDVQEEESYGEDSFNSNSSDSSDSEDSEDSVDSEDEEDEDGDPEDW